MMCKLHQLVFPLHLMFEWRFAETFLETYTLSLSLSFSLSHIHLVISSQHHNKVPRRRVSQTAVYSSQGCCWQRGVLLQQTEMKRDVEC